MLHPGTGTGVNQYKPSPLSSRDSNPSIAAMSLAVGNPPEQHEVGAGTTLTPAGRNMEFGFQHRSSHLAVAGIALRQGEETS
jgi:hypothetical protein